LISATKVEYNTCACACACVNNRKSLF